MKKNQQERRVLGRLMAVEVEHRELRRAIGGMATFNSGGEATVFYGGWDTNGSPYVSHDPLPV